ncbi:MAG: xanthine dehydrogenase small subunit [Rubrivivax sp.]|nr:xanthine dehydrogenase small subunit [Rubrivivax sp.]MBK7261019.1 xanthine dehydrogenase small subunit [Rubrivivax sp.]MBK8525954.1 xanthine dehydrogenase small subunit [Rubrivivax sp.]
MNTRPIRFVHRGQVVEVDGPAATRSLLDWLREDAGCTGTKEGCAEGDCGACTVVVGHLDADGALQTQTVNACIQFLPVLDGKAVITVEDLSPPQGPLHPVQQAMVDCHGSQCGFCTPGFVMSLWACQQRHTAAATTPTRQDLADELAGNLCRCTGYRPILDAGQSLFERPAPAFDSDPLCAALQTLATDPPLAYRDRYWAPRSLAEFARLRAERPQALVLAGATDIGLWVNKQLRELPELIFIGDVAELQRIDCVDGRLHIGAAATLDAAWRALAEHWPQLHELWLRFASPPVRHAGTMGGNVANGSPIGDSAPVLMALGARIVLQRAERRREMALTDFYTGYLKNRLEIGEFVHSLVVPLPKPQTRMRAYKISKRFDSDISALCAALAVDLDAQGSVLAARLAYGGMAATVQRAAAAEAALVGQSWTEAALQQAMAALAGDFKPMSDQRASAAYRLQVAQNLLRRFWLETRVDGPLPASALSVWARETSA